MFSPPSLTTEKPAKNGRNSTETVQQRPSMLGTVRSHKWLAKQRPHITNEAACCPCVVYARTAERLERAAYDEDPLAPPSGGCNSTCWSCFLSSAICNWKEPLRDQRGDIRNRYAITGSMDDDDVNACAHPFWTLMLNHNEVLIREKICRDLKTYPFPPGPPPKEIRRFKAQPDNPYKSPSQMQMKTKNLPRILELPESGNSTGRHEPPSTLTSPELGKVEPETSSQSPPLRDHKRQDTPARSPDVLRSPLLDPRDPHVTVADFAEPHRLNQDPKKLVAMKQYPHTVHNDPLFGIAEEVHPHTVHNDPTAQVARRLAPHQIMKDPRTPVVKATAPHSVHHDPTVKVAEEPMQHSVHDDQTANVTNSVYDHRLSQDCVAPVSTRMNPHSINDDQTAGIPSQPASHSLSGDPMVARSENAAPHSVHDEPAVKVAEDEPKQHALHTSAAARAPEKKPSPHQLGDIGRSATAPAELDKKSATVSVDTSAQVAGGGK
ncbi:wd domain-containing protein [Colletotrichum incanum]|uniref:Wd domain-containing protein n=1 Tax=Colletotrichum incanum TaxID=1573173 RepID=A0A167C3H8_COLIC|nr:wd domain-containing protein [Colletotrichum incanum]OHW94665.1 PLAC8 domain containing protein [Colletotrichum incanum]